MMAVEFLQCVHSFQRSGLLSGSIALNNSAQSSSFHWLSLLLLNFQPTLTDRISCNLFIFNLRKSSLLFTVTFNQVHNVGSSPMFFQALHTRITLFRDLKKVSLGLPSLCSSVCLSVPNHTSLSYLEMQKDFRGGQVGSNDVKEGQRWWCVMG